MSPWTDKMPLLPLLLLFVATDERNYSTNITASVSLRWELGLGSVRKVGFEYSAVDIIIIIKEIHTHNRLTAFCPGLCPGLRG